MGPYHDQYIEPKYLDVESYELISSGIETVNPTVAHGDLLGTRYVWKMVGSSIKWNFPTERSSRFSAEKSSIA